MTAKPHNFTHRYHWCRDALGRSRKGQLCRIVCVGKKRSCLVEFEDGTRVVTSLLALRRL